MTKAPEIILRASTRTVQVSEIPVLMAQAIHPEPKEPLVLKEIVKAYLGPNGEYDGRTQPLADGDMELLIEILGIPPQPGQATTDDEWLAYIAEWSNSPKRPAWTPGRQCINAEFDAAILRADAEDRVRKDLLDAIRAGSFVPLSHALVPLVGGERELLSIGQVFVQELRDYAAKSKVSVQVEIDGVIIEDLAESISQERTDRRPEKWKHPTDLDPLRRTLVAAMNKHGWPLDGIPGVLPFIYAKIEVGDIHAFSLFNGLPCTDVSLVQANPAQWYVTENAARHLLKAMLGFVDGTHGIHENTDDSETLVTHQVKSILYNNSDEPIYEEWGEYPKLTARQAVPLMHGLNPKFFALEDAPTPPGRASRMDRAKELFRVCGHRIGVAEAADLGKLTSTEWLKWATECNWPVCTEFRAMTGASAASPNAHKLSGDEPEWVIVARQVYIEVAAVERPYSRSQEDNCKDVEKALIERGIKGPHNKTLSAATIKREAISGEWWRANFGTSAKNSQGKGEIKKGK